MRKKVTHAWQAMIVTTDKLTTGPQQAPYLHLCWVVLLGDIGKLLFIVLTTVSTWVNAAFSSICCQNISGVQNDL